MGLGNLFPGRLSSPQLLLQECGQELKQRCEGCPGSKSDGAILYEELERFGGEKKENFMDAAWRLMTLRCEIAHVVCVKCKIPGLAVAIAL